MRCKSLCLLVVVGLLLGACAPATKPLGSADRPIRMSMVPFLETSRLVKGMQSISAALEQETGLKYTSDVPTSYAAVIEAMCADQVEIGWLSPLAYVLARKKCGADMSLVSVNRTGTSYRGMVIARADSPVQQLADFKGKRFAWVDSGSTSGYLFPRALFEEKGLATESLFGEQVFAGGHDKVVIAVVNGQVDGGAIFKDQRDRMTGTLPDVFSKTRVIAETPDIPNDGVAFSKNLPADIVTKTRQALLKITATDEGKKLFEDAIGTFGVAETTDAAYEPVRQAATVLKLDLEAEMAKPK
jgi:phosphonate transport system substrate-binding protein